MTVTPVDGVRYWFNDTARAFEAPGRPALQLPSVGVGRDALVPGTYKPNTPDVVGLTGDPITSIVGTGANISITQPFYENTIFWGKLLAGSVVAEFRNCIIAGPDPDTLTGISGNFQSFDSTTVARAHITFTDCLISSKPWTINALGRPLAAGATRLISPLSAGLHGGNFTLNRCEVTDVQDGVNYTNGRDDSFCLIEASWLHHTFYKYPWSGPGAPADGHTHSDFFQFNRGKNITVRNSVIGGIRNQAAYDRTDGTAANEGDDTYGACFMVKQEVGYTAYDQIHNVLIENNWIGGGEYCFNMVYVAARPNTFSDFTIRNNKFPQGYPPEFYRIGKSNQLTPIVTGNVIEETGAAVVAQNTGYSE